MCLSLLLDHISIAHVLNVLAISQEVDIKRCLLVNIMTNGINSSKEVGFQENDFLCLQRSKEVYDYISLKFASHRGFFFFFLTGLYLTGVPTGSYLAVCGAGEARRVERG